MERQEIQRRPSGLLFPRNGQHKWKRAHAIGKDFNRLVKKIAPDLSFHCWRHYAISEMMNAGMYLRKPETGQETIAIETEIIEPLEEEINTVEGLKKMTSTAREEVGNIVAEFELWRDRYPGKLTALEEAGTVEPKPGIPPSPKHVAELIEVMKKQKIRIILAANYFDKRFRITLNTDNRLMSGVSVSSEVALVATTFGLDLDEVHQLQCNAALATFTDRDRRMTLLDRIDLQLEVVPVPFGQLSREEHSEGSESMREMVTRARDIQKRRFNDPVSGLTNARMGTSMRNQHCRLDPAGTSLIRMAMEKLGLSARAYDRILKVSRVASFMIRSTYRCRYRVSVSDRP